MLFKDFAGYLEKLEKISSRLEITKVLAELIEKMSVEETDKGIYLTLGQLGPDFDNKEFNMAIKMVLRSVVEGTGVSANEIERKYKDKGDVGLVVEELDFKRNTAVKYSVNEIFEKLKLLRSHGRAESGDYFKTGDYMDYITLGYNFRMSDITAALGISQLKKVDKLIGIRRAHAEYLKDILTGIDEIDKIYTDIEW